MSERSLDCKVTQGTSIYRHGGRTLTLWPLQKERNWLILELQKYAKAQHARVSIVSGDVHCAAVGLLKTWVKEKKRPDIPPPQDHRYMVNVVTSESTPAFSTQQWVF